MARPRTSRLEARGLGGLEQHAHGSARDVGHVGREWPGCRENEVEPAVVIRDARIGVTDLPQHVGLAHPGRMTCAPHQRNRRVLTSGERSLPLGSEPKWDSQAPPAEGALQVSRKWQVGHRVRSVPGLILELDRELRGCEPDLSAVRMDLAAGPVTAIGTVPRRPRARDILAVRRRARCRRRKPLGGGPGRRIACDPRDEDRPRAIAPLPPSGRSTISMSALSGRSMSVQPSAATASIAARARGPGAAGTDVDPQPSTSDAPVSGAPRPCEQVRALRPANRCDFLGRVRRDAPSYGSTRAKALHAKMTARTPQLDRGSCPQSVVAAGAETADGVERRASQQQQAAGQRRRIVACGSPPERSGQCRHRRERAEPASVGRNAIRRCRRLSGRGGPAPATDRPAGTGRSTATCARFHEALTIRPSQPVPGSRCRC